MPNGALQTLAAADVFISSSSEPEALELRTRLEEIVHQINLDLAAENRRLCRKLVQWRAVTPTQIPSSTMSEKFAEMATRADAVVALLVRDSSNGRVHRNEGLRCRIETSRPS